jgi:hypothetical protein
MADSIGMTYQLNAVPANQALEKLGRGIVYSDRMLTHLDRTTNVFERSLLKTSRSINSVIFGFKGLIAVAAAWYAGSRVARGFRGLIAAGAGAEDTMVRLTTALQDSAKAAETYAWAVELANRTPFETEDVVRATTQLQAYGINARQMVKSVEGQISIMEVLGNVAGATGKDVMQAVEAYADGIMGEGERLKEFGIKLSNIPGLKGLQAGSQEYAQVVLQFLANQQRFAGGMSKMASTYTGVMSTIRGIFKQLLVEVAQGGIFERFKGTMTTFKNFLEQNNAKLTVIARAIGQVLGNVWANLDRFFTNRILPMLQRAIDRAYQWALNLKDTWYPFATVVSMIAEYIKRKVQQIGQWWDKVWDDDKGKKIGGGWKGFGATMKGLVEEWREKGFIGMLRDAWADVKEKFQDTGWGDKIAGKFDELKGHPWTVAVVEKWNEAKTSLAETTWAQAIKSKFDELKEHPWVATIVSKWDEATIFMRSKWDEFVAYVTERSWVDRIRDKFEAIKATFNRFVYGEVPASARWMGNVGIAGLAEKQGGLVGLRETMKGLWDDVAESAGRAEGRIGRIVGHLGNLKVDAIARLKEAFEKIEWEKAMPVVQGLTKVVAGGAIIALTGALLMGGQGGLLASLLMGRGGLGLIGALVGGTVGAGLIGQGLSEMNLKQLEGNRWAESLERLGAATETLGITSGGLKDLGALLIDLVARFIVGIAAISQGVRETEFLWKATKLGWISIVDRIQWGIGEIGNSVNTVIHNIGAVFVRVFDFVRDAYAKVHNFIADKWNQMPNWLRTGWTMEKIPIGGAAEARAYEAMSKMGLPVYMQTQAAVQALVERERAFLPFAPKTYEESESVRRERVDVEAVEARLRPGRQALGRIREAWNLQITVEEGAMVAKIETPPGADEKRVVDLTREVFGDFWKDIVGGIKTEFSRVGVRAGDVPITIKHLKSALTE